MRVRAIGTRLDKHGGRGESGEDVHRLDSAVRGGEWRARRSLSPEAEKHDNTVPCRHPGEKGA